MLQSAHFFSWDPCNNFLRPGAVMIMLPRMYNVTWVVAGVLCGTRGSLAGWATHTFCLTFYLMRVLFLSPDQTACPLRYSREESLGVPWLCLSYFMQFLLQRYLRAHGAWGECLYAEVNWGSHAPCCGSYVSSKGQVLIPRSHATLWGTNSLHISPHPTLIFTSHVGLSICLFSDNLE